MKAVIALLAFASVAQAGLLAAPAVLSAPTVIARAPALDSAVIKSDRIGGNFAYSVAESHAYAAHTPIIQHVATPVAVSYSAPAVVAHHQVVAAPAIAAVKTIAAPTIIAGSPAATIKLA